MAEIDSQLGVKKYEEGELLDGVEDLMEQAVAVVETSLSGQNIEKAVADAKRLLENNRSKIRESLYTSLIGRLDALLSN